MLKKAKVIKGFTGSVDGINLKDFKPGEPIEGPIGKINEWLANGWVEIQKEYPDPKNKPAHENKMTAPATTKSTGPEDEPEKVKPKQKYKKGTKAK